MVQRMFSYFPPFQCRVLTCHIFFNFNNHKKKKKRYGEAGNSKVLVCVYGPRPSERAPQFSDTAALRVEVRMARFCSGLREEEARAREQEQELAVALRQALEVLVRLERYPKSTIEAHCLVLEHDGSLFSLALPLASLALIDAGIEVLDFASAATVAITSTSTSPGSRGGVTLVLDPTRAVEANAAAVVSVAVMPSLNEVIQLLQQGELSPADLDAAMRMALDASSKVFSLMRTLVTPDSV